MSESPAGPLEQLKQALESGAISQATFDQAAAALNAAQLSGAGAIAQGPQALAAGAGGVAIGGDNSGDINLGVIIQLGAKRGAGAGDLRRAYLARILTQANQVPLFAGDDLGSKVRLASIYTALLTKESEPSLEKARQNAPGTIERETAHLSAVDVLNRRPRLALLGGPGSGKSTFVNVVAMSMAGELLKMPAPSLATLTAPLPREERERFRSTTQPAQPQRWDHAPLLPVRIVLRELASQLPAPGQPIDAETLKGFVQRQLKAWALESFAPLLWAELLQRGGLVLLDGLDEVPDALERREQIKKVVEEFEGTFAKCRFVVTSRTYAYQRQDWKLDGFAEVELLPFTPGQIGAFVDAWYAHMVELERLSEAAAAERAEVLKREVERNERIRELAERPLLLTLMAQLQTKGGGSLPQKREELYDKAVDMLLNAWESMKVLVRPDGSKEIQPSLAEWLDADTQDIRRQLNRLAFEAHRDQQQLSGTADIAQDRLVTALLDASAKRADVKVKRLVEYLRDRAGILAPHGIGVYQFPHRSFQEYLAACHLTDDDFPDKLARLARADPNRWREVVLLAGAKAARGSTLSAWALSESLCLQPPPPPEAGAVPEADHWGALLAGRVLVDSADLARVADRDEPKRARVRDWQRTVMRRNTLPGVERALAGRTLAALGDTRPEVMTLDGMHFCLVPPGPFVMGDDKGAADERPEHKLDLPYPYFIARFPITVAQWREVLARSGRAADDERSLQGRNNDPAIHVSWHDAMRACEALTQRWRQKLPAGFIVTLPSEPEWEKAARGGERIPATSDWLTLPRLAPALAAAAATPMMPNPLPRRSFPWGEAFDVDKANAEMVIGETSAVGCYPAGDSPYGCEEMSGNVWEWTRSLWGTKFGEPAFKYPYRIDERKREDAKAKDDVLRVVRGGSWYYSRVNARCAFRLRLHPDFRDYYLGFRVVLRSSPVLSKR